MRDWQMHLFLTTSTLINPISFMILKQALHWPVILPVKISICIPENNSAISWMYWLLFCLTGSQKCSSVVRVCVCMCVCVWVTCVCDVVWCVCVCSRRGRKQGGHMQSSSSGVDGGVSHQLQWSSDRFLWTTVMWCAVSACVCVLDRAGSRVVTCRALLVV